MCFLYLEEWEKKLRNRLGREQKPKKVVSFGSDGCQGLLLARRVFRGNGP